MVKNELCRRILELNFKPSEYWAIMGTSMVLFGIRNTTEDIDLGCSSQMADYFEKNGLKAENFVNGKRYFKFSDDVEIFEDWGAGNKVLINGIPTVSLEGLKKMKLNLGRKKDIDDVKLIDQYLNVKAKDYCD